MKTGVLTEFPDADGNLPKKEDPDGLDFEPPSEAQLEDRLDPMTKQAIEAGVPLDEAVTAGRKMAAGGELPLSAQVEEQVQEQKAAPRIIHYQMPSVSLLKSPSRGTRRGGGQTGAGGKGEPPAVHPAQL